MDCAHAWWVSATALARVAAQQKHVNHLSEAWGWHAAHSLPGPREGPAHACEVLPFSRQMQGGLRAAPWLPVTAAPDLCSLQAEWR